MSLFAETTKSIDVPNKNVAVTIRKFTRREIDRVLSQPPAEIWRAAMLGLPATGDEKSVRPGLVSWPDERPISAETIVDLDFDDSEFIAKQILFLANPHLKILIDPDPEKAAEVEQKNG